LFLQVILATAATFEDYTMYQKHQHLPFGMPSAIILAFSALCSAGFAQADTLRFSLGAMAGISQSPFDTKKTTKGVMPDFLVEGDQFSFGTAGLTLDVVKSGGVTLAARIAPRWGDADPADVPALKGLKRKTAVEAGLAASMQFGALEAGVEALKDVSDTHNGMAVNMSVSTGMECTDRLSVGANVSALWMDSKLATYSYGVRPKEATGTLAAYGVKASVIPSVGLQANYTVTDHMSLVGSVQAQFLPKSVTRSPIIKRDTMVSAMLGVRYAF
jgi:MipA family protein